MKDKTIHLDFLYEVASILLYLDNFFFNLLFIFTFNHQKKKKNLFHLFEAC